MRCLTPILTVTALAAGACNPPEAKDRDSIPITLEVVDASLALAGFNIESGVDAQVRDMQTSIDIGFSTIYAEGELQNIELTVIEGLLEEISSATWSEGTVSVTITPNYSACDGVSYTIRDDGGCDYAFGAFLAGDAPYGGIASFDLQSQADDEWEGDPDSLNVFIDATVAESEKTQ